MTDKCAQYIFDTLRWPSGEAFTGEPGNADQKHPTNRQSANKYMSTNNKIKSKLMYLINILLSTLQLEKALNV